jgi:hypothetical protein
MRDGFEVRGSVAAVYATVFSFTGSDPVSSGVCACIRAGVLERLV